MRAGFFPRKFRALGSIARQRSDSHILKSRSATRLGRWRHANEIHQFPGCNVRLSVSCANGVGASARIRKSKRGIARATAFGRGGAPADQIQRDAAGCAGAADDRARGSYVRALRTADGRRGTVGGDAKREAGWKRKLHGPAWGEQRERAACGAIHFRGSALAGDSAAAAARAWKAYA